jgi:membrane protease YdiL (CAAX protease family)
MRSLAKRHPLTSFFVLVYGISWGLDALRLLLGIGTGLPAVFLLEAAGAGPSLAGLLVSWAAYGRRGLRLLLGRAFRWRVGLGWYVLVLVAFPALLVGVIAVAMILSGQPFRVVFPGPFWLLPAFMPLVLFLGPLQEELGWRAFALPELIRRHGWLPAGLVLGLAWALWHRTPSTWSAIAWSDPSGPAGLLGLLLGAVVPDVALSVLMAWVFVRTRGSALLAGLGMHTVANYALFLPALPTGPTAEATTWAVTWAFAGCLTALALLAVFAERKAGATGRFARSPEEATRGGDGRG